MAWNPAEISRKYFRDGHYLVEVLFRSDDGKEHSAPFKVINVRETDWFETTVRAYNNRLNALETFVETDVPLEGAYALPPPPAPPPPSPERDPDEIKFNAELKELEQWLRGVELRVVPANLPRIEELRTSMSAAIAAKPTLRDQF